MICHEEAVCMAIWKKDLGLKSGQFPAPDSWCTAWTWGSVPGFTAKTEPLSTHILSKSGGTQEKGFVSLNSPDGPIPPGLDAAGSANLLNPSLLFCVLIQHVEKLNETFLMAIFNMTFMTSWENALIIRLMVKGRRREILLCGWRQ